MSILPRIYLKCLCLEIRIKSDSRFVTQDWIFINLFWLQPMVWSMYRTTIVRMVWYNDGYLLEQGSILVLSKIWQSKRTHERYLTQWLDEQHKVEINFNEEIWNFWKNCIPEDEMKFLNRILSSKYSQNYHNKTELVGHKI